MNQKTNVFEDPLGSVDVKIQSHEKRTKQLDKNTSSLQRGLVGLSAVLVASNIVFAHAGLNALKEAARHSKAGNIDRLTNLVLPKYMIEHGHELNQKMLRKNPGQSTFAMWIDINGLSVANSLFGEDGGDKLLKTTEGIIRNQLTDPASIVVGRSGPNGDEFFALFAANDQQHAKKIIQNIQKEAKQLSVNWEPVRHEIERRANEYGVDLHSVMDVHKHNYYLNELKKMKENPQKFTMKPYLKSFDLFREEASKPDNPWFAPRERKGFGHTTNYVEVGDVRLEFEDLMKKLKSGESDSRAHQEANERRFFAEHGELNPSTVQYFESGLHYAGTYKDRAPEHIGIPDSIRPNDSLLGQAIKMFVTNPFSKE